MKLIDADALERDGWRMSRIVQIDEKTMELQTRKPTDFPAVEPPPEPWEGEPNDRCRRTCDAKKRDSRNRVTVL